MKKKNPISPEGKLLIMKKDKDKNLIILLLSLIIIYMVFKYIIPRILFYATVILALIPPLMSKIFGLVILVLIFYLIIRVLKKK